MRYTVGVDIGTFETKGVLVNELGKVEAQAHKSHKMLVPQPGWAEHRPNEDWWGDFCEVTNNIIKTSGVNAEDIECVACSAIGPCMLPVDQNGNPLMNGVLYGVDTRSHEEIDILNSNIGEDKILEMCGNSLTSQSVGPKILWLKRNKPEIFKQTAKILTSTSFIVHKLTENFVIDHYTAANFSPLYNIHTQNWSDELTKDIISIDYLPTLKWSTELVGTITEKAASETGLPKGIPVTTGTIDAAAEAISIGLSNEGDTMCMYGSTIFMISLTREQNSDPRLWYAPWLFEGEHASMAGLATSGTLTHWFREQFGKELDLNSSFAELIKAANTSQPGANGIVFLPYFSGERTPIHDPNAKGTIFGLRLDHVRGDVYRSLIEGIAYGTRHVIETFEDAGTQTNNLYAVGGGTKNDLWLQSTSDITGIDQIVRENTIGASYGNAFLAAFSMGFVKREMIENWNPTKKKIIAEVYEVHDRNYEIFKSLYEVSKHLMKKI